MSSVSILDKLLGEMEVEWKPLGGLGELIRGNGLQKKDFTETGVPAIHYGQIYTHYGLSTTKTKSFVSPELAKQLRKVDKGDVVITNTSENLADVGKALVYLGETQAVTGGHATVLKPGKRLLGKYFAHFTQTAEFAGEKRKYAKGTKVIDVSATDMAKIPIPIPCPDNPQKSLEIQAEIVRILDAYAELTAELTAELSTELSARKRQHEHYRDLLFNFGDDAAEWRELGDLFPFIRNGFVGTVTPYYTDAANGVRYLQGTNIQKGAINDNKKYYVTRDFHEKLSRTKLQSTDILVVQSGHVGESAVVGEKYANCNCHALIVMSNGGQCNSKFVNYFLQTTEGKNRLSKITTGETVKHILASKIKKMTIPLPSIETQARIVATLDKFDALTNSLTEGLPLEIGLRQKQYAYYRDLLLSFPKPGKVEV